MKYKNFHDSIEIVPTIKYANAINNKSVIIKDNKGK